MSQSSAVAEAGGNLLSRGALSESEALSQFAGNLPRLRELASEISSSSSSAEQVIIRALEYMSKYDWAKALHTTQSTLYRFMAAFDYDRMMQHAHTVMEHFGDLSYEGISNVYRDVYNLGEAAMKIGRNLLQVDREAGFPLFNHLSSFRAVWEDEIMHALEIPQYFPPGMVIALTSSMSELPRQIINSAWKLGADNLIQDTKALVEGVIQIGGDMAEVLQNYRAAVGIASTAAALTVGEIGSTIENLDRACDALTVRGLSPIPCAVRIANTGLSFFERFFRTLVNLGADVIGGAANALVEASRETWDKLDSDDLDRHEKEKPSSTSSVSTTVSSTGHSALHCSSVVNKRFCQFYLPNPQGIYHPTPRALQFTSVYRTTKTSSTIPT